MRNRFSLALLVGAAYGLVGCNSDGPSSTTAPNDGAVFGVASALDHGGRGGDYTFHHAPGFHRGFPPFGLARVGVIDPLIVDRVDDDWQVVLFSPPFPKKARVIVIPMTQTYNGSDPPNVRIQNVTNEGFEIRFDELLFNSNLGLIESDGFHVDETVGWVAYALGGPHAEDLAVSR